jgi:PleD family two-component response regulator
MFSCQKKEMEKEEDRLQKTYQQRKMSLDPHAFSILVVDDEKVARLALTRMLIKCGYNGIHFQI